MVKYEEIIAKALEKATGIDEKFAEELFLLYAANNHANGRNCNFTSFEFV